MLKASMKYDMLNEYIQPARFEKLLLLWEQKVNMPQGKIADKNIHISEEENEAK